MTGRIDPDLDLPDGATPAESPRAESGSSEEVARPRHAPVVIAPAVQVSRIVTISGDSDADSTNRLPAVSADGTPRVVEPKAPTVTLPGPPSQDILEDGWTPFAPTAADLRLDRTPSRGEVSSEDSEPQLHDYDSIVDLAKTTLNAAFPDSRDSSGGIDVVIDLEGSGTFPAAPPLPSEGIESPRAQRPVEAPLPSDELIPDEDPSSSERPPVAPARAPSAPEGSLPPVPPRRPTLASVPPPPPVRLPAPSVPPPKSPSVVAEGEVERRSDRPRAVLVPPMPPRPRSVVDAGEMGRPRSVVDAGEMAPSVVISDDSPLSESSEAMVVEIEEAPARISVPPPAPRRKSSADLVPQQAPPSVLVDGKDRSIPPGKPDFPTDYGTGLLGSPSETRGDDDTPVPVAPRIAEPASDSVVEPRRDAPEAPPRPRIAAPAATPLVFTGTGGSFPPVAPPDAKRKARPWWEELFGEDYLRASPPISGAHLQKECDFIDDSLALEGGASILDLACGTGEYAIDLARRGYQMVGYDLSLSMLSRASDEAQDRNLKINFLQGDMREMPFEDAFDGAYCWNTSFGYFEDAVNQAIIARVHKALKRGGQFLLDVINRDFVAQDSPSSVWFQGDGCICMDEMNLDWISSRMRVKRTMMLDGGRSCENEYSIRVYSLHELGKMLHDAGFRVAEVSGRTETPGVFFGGQASRILILAEKR